MAAIRFDMRLAPFSTVTEAEQYSQSLEMAAWGDAHGFSAITVSEHHGVDFISAPVTLAAMMLGCTKHVARAW